MARSLRPYAALLLVLAAACSAAPPQHPAASANLEQVAAVPPRAAVSAAVTSTPESSSPRPNQSEAAAPDDTFAAAAAPDASQPAVAAAQPVATVPEAQAAMSAAQVDTAPAQPAATAQPAVPDSTPAGNAGCDDTARPDPLPAPGSPRAQDFFRAFRTPLAPAPLYDPPGPRRVGLQAGHWLTDQVPPELGRLQGGSVGGGKQEWEVNLEVASRAAALLQNADIQVDVLPATVPPSYRANAFVALHADGDPTGAVSGFKVARPGFSSLPDIDDRLVETLNQVYGGDTQLPRDDEHISLRMRYYYAFNSRRYCHAVAPGVPQAIIEMGYLTSPADRRLLIGDPDRLARGIADSVQAFLSTIP